MISIRRLLLREFLIIGSLALVLLLGARSIAELWTLREQATTQADSGLKLLMDGINHQVQQAEELGNAVALMWRRGEIAPGQPGAELTLEGLLRQSEAQNLVLTDTQGRSVSAQDLDGAFATSSLISVDGKPHTLVRRWDADGKVASSQILDMVVPDLTQRPWYRQAMTSGGPSWTGPYLFISPGVAGVTYYRRAVDASGRSQGAVGVDLQLDALKRLMRKYKPTPNALTRLTGADGQILAPPDRQAPLSSDAEDLDSLIKAALTSKTAQTGWPVVRAGSRFWLVHQDRVERTGWRMLVAIPMNDLISAPGRITMAALAIGLLAIFAIALRLASVSRRIAQPLLDLERSSEALLAGQTLPFPPTDIRELAQARAALEAASLSMQERHKLELELQRMQRLDLVGTMAAGLAHDMNNHLTAIQGQIQLAALSAREGPQAAHIAQAEEACQGMARLLKDLVAFGKPRALHSDRVDLNVIVGLVGKLLEHSRGKRMRVDLDLDHSGPVVAGDPIQLEQVILNLGFNAKDATPEGGLLTLTTGRKGGEAFFEVRDTGTGMTPAVREKLFTPFFSTKGEDQGTGLGLAMVASIVKAHHGRILVESEPGHGSAFTVWLPLARAANS
ncbi:MAG TPA: ATP-binding protein [Holophagaceae bacterium]|nr:ATP-binding protein [Holophagaceae bacterium]